MSERQYFEVLNSYVEHFFSKSRPHRRDARKEDMLVYGEYTSATMSGSHTEMEWKSVEVPGAVVSAYTSAGGPGSKYKDVNEDTILLQTNGNRLRVGVIDGAGGSEDGRTASVIANALFMEGGRQVTPNLDADADNVTQSIQSHAPGSYATGVMLEMNSDSATLLSAGDSKAMTVRGGKKFPDGTTRMQNKVQQLIELGLVKPWEYYSHPFNNVVTGAFGAKDSAPEKKSFVSQPGDQIVLASDGVWDVVSEYEIEMLAARFHGNELQEKIFKLAYARNNASTQFRILFDEQRFVMMEPLNGGDNISVVVVEKKKREPVYAIGDFVTIQLPGHHGTNINWRIMEAVDADERVLVQKIVHGELKKARVPIEQLTELNVKGASRLVVFGEVQTKQELFDALDAAQTIHGSQRSYSAEFLKKRFQDIEDMIHADVLGARQFVNTITEGEENQKLHAAFMRVLGL